MKIWFSIGAAASMLIFLAGCSSSSSSTISTTSDSLTNDTSNLDNIVRDDPQAVNFVSRVKLYYKALQDKDWPTSYEMRTSDFRHDVSKDLYLETMKDAEKNWRLTRYQVLNSTMYSGTNGAYAAQIIMKFQERGITSYACAVWKKENGTWVCDEPGLGAALLHSTRVPSWAD